MQNLGGIHRKLLHLILLRDFFTRLADQVRQRKQGYRKSFKDYGIDIQTMGRTLN